MYILLIIQVQKYLLGFSVDGSKKDIEAFEAGKIVGLPYVVDSEGTVRDVDPTTDYDTIIKAIMVSKLVLWQRSRTIKQEILDLTSVDECIAYEHTEIQVPMTIPDIETFDKTTLEEFGTTLGVDLDRRKSIENMYNDLMQVVHTLTTTKTINKVKEW